MKEGIGLDVQDGFMKSSLGARKTVRYELNTNAYDRYEMADFHLKIIYIDIFS